MDRKKLFNTLAILIVAIFLINALANKFYWYSSIWYFDMIMHFLGGLWVGILAFYFFSPQTISFRLILKILMMVFMVGVGWEIFEVLVDKVVFLNSFSIIDTVSDIIFDIIGGIAAIFYYMKKIMTVKPNKVQSN
jgi:hypothetical protein